jgi:hypothetical protein
VCHTSLAGPAYITFHRLQQCTEDVDDCFCRTAVLIKFNNSLMAGTEWSGCIELLVIMSFIIGIMVQSLRRARDDGNAFAMVKKDSNANRQHFILKSYNNASNSSLH